MVKKGQAKGGKPGGGGGAKKPSPATAGDDSFIVFSNSDNDPKPKKQPENGAAGPSAQDGPALAGEAPKRPDVKKLIGGASWTGKLPVNMLSEHCQKQRWEKPEYTMVSICDVLWGTANCSVCFSPRPPKATPRW
jgi:ATP-dependent RNA helicase DHX57